MSIDKAKALKNAQKYTQKGQFDKAVSEYLKLIEVDPGEKTYKNFLGDLYLKQGNQDMAIRAFMEAAGVYQSEGFTPHTIALYKKILRIDPHRMEIYQDLGKLYAEQGLVGDAITNFKIAADHFFARGQKQHALKTYKNIVDLDPKNLNVKLRLAELYAKEGMRAEAAAQYSGVAEKLSAAGKADESFSHYTRARELQPENVDALKGLIALCLNQERFQDAVAHMEALRGLEPANVQNLLLLGKTFMKLGRRDAAIEIFEKAVSADPSQLQVHETLGRLYLERGDRTRAWNHLLPVVETSLNQNDRQTAGRLLEEFSTQLGGEKGFLQKQYEHAVQTGDPARRMTYGKKLAGQFEDAKAPDRALVVYRDLVQIAPQDPEIGERLRALSAFYEPPPPIRSVASNDSLEIDLEQIDLSDLQEFGDAEGESLAHVDVPLELDFGATPMPGPPPKGVNPQGTGRIPTKGSTPAPRKVDLVDVDLSGLDLGEGFGVETQTPIRSQTPARTPSRPPAQAQPPGPKTAPLSEMDFSFEGLPPSREASRPSVQGQPPGPKTVPLSEMDFRFEGPPPIREATRPSVQGQPPGPKTAPLSEMDFSFEGLPPSREASRPSVQGQPPGPKTVPLSEMDLSFGDLSDSGLPIELELPPAPPLPPLRAPAPAFQPEPPPRTPSRSQAQVLEELSASVDDLMPDLQIGESIDLEPSGFQLPPAPPAQQQFEPLDFGSMNLGPSGSKDAAGAKRQPKAKASRALDQLDLLSVPEKPKVPDRAKTPESLKLPDNFRASEPVPRTPERPRASEAFDDQAFSFEITAPPAPVYSPPERSPHSELPSRMSPPPPVIALPPSPSAGKPSTDMLDITTDFFNPKEAEENPDGLIDLGDLILGDQPVAQDDEENVNELLRQLREGIEAQVSKDDYDTHYNLGIAYKEMGLLDEAVDEFRKASGDKARRVDCISNIGLCYVQRGMIDEAVTEFRKGLSDPECLEQDRVGLSYELGLVYEQKGESAKAAEAFRLAAKIDPSFRDVREKLRNTGGGGDADLGAAKDRVSFL